MGSETREATESTGRGSAAERDARSGAALRPDLCASLLDGMHSMAQPLTNLQARFQLAEVEAAQRGADCERLLEGGREIEQLCVLFRLMQEVLHLACMPVRRSPVSLARVLVALADDAEAAFAGYDLCLCIEKRFETDAARLMVAVDWERTRKGLWALLSIVRESAAAGTKLDSAVELCEAGAKITIGVWGAAAATKQQPQSETGRLQMALARECFACGGDPLEISVDPVRVRFTMDLA